MQCPVCQADRPLIVDSRASRDSIRRRRACRACAHRFTTYETIHDAAQQARVTGIADQLRAIADIVERW